MACVFIYVVAVTVFSIVLQNARSARLDISPARFIEAVTGVVVVSCTPDGTGARAKQILVIEISKDGNTSIAHILPPDNIQLGNPQTNHYEVHGLANNSDIPNSYLNLTINYPSKDDTGTYTCVMSYIDETGMVKQDTSQADLRLNSSDYYDVETRVRHLETALDHLLERIKDVEQANFQLQAEVRNHTTQIELLREKSDISVAFSATVNTDKHIATGEVLVFSDVMINEGQGYNATTGVFRAPTAGLYSFHLVLEIGLGGAIGEICLNVAGKDVAKMYTQDKDFGDQGAITSVNRLKAGDTVKAVVSLAGGNTPRVFSERLSVFTGYLIQA